MTVSSKLDTHPGLRSIYWNRAEITDALQHLESQQTVLLDQLTTLLNSYHGWNRSPSYYDFLCGEWLLHFSHVVYAAYLEVIRNGGPGPDISPLPVFADHRDFQRVNINSFSFNRQLRSIVSETLAKGRGHIRSFGQNSLLYGAGSASRRLDPKRAIFNSVTRFVGRKDAPFVFCYPDAKCSRFRWIKTLQSWRRWAKLDDFIYPVTVTADVDADWRCDRSNAVSVSTFLDVFRALLPLYIPVIYLEGFAAYRRQAHALKLPTPKAIYTAYGLHGHVLFKTLAADWRENGTKVFNHQHGGGYGLGLIEPNENYEIRVSDRYYTAGWRGQSEKVKPLCIPSPGGRYQPLSSGRLLLNLLTMPRHVYRIHFGGMPGNIEGMIAATVDFVREMRGHNELVVRPYHDDYGRGMVETLRRVDPGLRIDDIHVSGLKSYARSAVVIHNYLGTSWLQTLALNIPTVCFYNTDTYAFREAAQPYIDALAAVGILHQSGTDAARFVYGIMNDPYTWWQRPEVQAARQAFIRNYANYSSRWASRWEAEFGEWIV